MKVIRSPIVYEAEQFHSNGNIPKAVKVTENGTYYISTKHGTYFLDDGDYILSNNNEGVEVYPEEKFKRIFERFE